MIPDVPRLSRRSVVAVAAVGAVAGCSGSGGGSGGSGPGRAASEPGAAETAQALRDSTALLGAYDAAIAAHPSLAGRLAPLRAEVARHVTAFGGAPPSPARPGTGPSATASAQPPAATATPPAARTPVQAAGGPAKPATAASALAALAARERALADRRAAALLDAPGELARLLASVAAAGAGHVVLLTSKPPKTS